MCITSDFMCLELLLSQRNLENPQEALQNHPMGEMGCLSRNFLPRYLWRHTGRRSMCSSCSVCSNPLLVPSLRRAQCSTDRQVDMALVQQGLRYGVCAGSRDTGLQWVLACFARVLRWKPMMGFEQGQISPNWLWGQSSVADMRGMDGWSPHGSK